MFEATRLDAAAAAARPASSSSCAFKGLQLRPRPRLLHRPAAAVFCWSCLSADAVVVVESLKLDFKFVVVVFFAAGFLCMAAAAAEHLCSYALPSSATIDNIIIIIFFLTSCNLMSCFSS